MDHVTQHMPTAFAFKSSMTEPSRQTQHKPVGILREAKLGDDPYECMRAHPFAAVITRMLSGSWKLEVMHLSPKRQAFGGYANVTVACNLLFRQSLPFAVPQSEQEEKQNLTCSTDQFDSLHV